MDKEINKELRDIISDVKKIADDYGSFDLTRDQLSIFLKQYKKIRLKK